MLENELIKKKPVYLYTLRTLAASVIFVLFFFSYTYYENTKVSYSHEYVSINEINKNIILPDKTIIDMDIKSKLYITYYKNKRVVKFFNGKALFTVSKDKKRPFIIHSGKTRIEVLGTKFEVINLNNLNTINVIEGSVKVSYVNNNKTKNLSILKKGDSLVLNEEGKVLKIQKINTEDIALWKENLLRFNKRTLKNALEDFSRYDDTKVIIKDYESANLRISGEFSTKELIKFYEALPFIYPVKITKEKNIINISKIQ